jgi:pyruvate dehydrogenase E2 component (dihydrolipoamide acetyltransferase)
MATPILMPKVSFVVTEGTIIEWLKKPGDPVTKGEYLLTIETEKATVDVEAPGTGLLGPSLAPKGTTVPVTTTIGYILKEGEVSPKWDMAPDESAHVEAAAPSKNEQLAQGSPEKEQVKAGEAQRSKVSPLAKRMAKELGLDLSKIKGTGPDGRILQEDIQAFVKASTPSEQKSQEPAHPMPAPQTSPAAPSPEIAMNLDGELQELSNLQRVSAERMAQSFRTAPHFYLNVQVDMSQAVVMREALLPDVEAKTGVRLSFTDILLLAVCQALKLHPTLNAMFDNGKLYRYKDINVSLAVDTPRGLTAPVFHHTDRSSLFEIAQQRSELVKRAQNSRLTLEDLSGGTFTVSNLGMFGIDVFNAIINPPQAAILAVGRIAKRPVVINEALELRSTMWLSLSVDHRVADGAEGARFLQDLVNYLENPYRILVK